MSTATTAPSTSFKSATRVQRSVLTALERRALAWLASRMPAAIHSDHLTALALVAMVGVGGGYWLASVTPLGLVLATVCLGINWFGDSLDGTLARYRDQQRPRYGYYVDHVVDVVGVLLLFMGLGLSGLMHPAIAAAALIAYFLVSLEVYLATHSLGEFHMSFLGVGPTELRLLLAAANITLLLRPTAEVAGTGLSPFDIGGLAASVGLVAVFLGSAIRNTRTLYRMETRR